MKTTEAMAISAEDIIRATGGRPLSGGAKTFSGVSIDTRTLSPGDVFFALKGARFDGHDFVGEAVGKCGGAVVHTVPEDLPENKTVILVDDTLRALQDLAHFMRMRRDVPAVAITGSNGKTTTKEMVYEILSGKFRTLRNKGNLNNLIGLPLSLAALRPEDEIIVLEMGMNAPGEIRRLCEIAAPTHVVITNVGSAHLGRLGSYEAVRDAKLESLDGQVTAVVNADDEGLMHGVRQVKDFKGKMITYGVHHNADVTARNVEATVSGSRFTIDFGSSGAVPVSLNVHGMFNVYNALAAAAVTFSLGMGTGEIASALESYRGFPMRFEVIRWKDITVINDSYNANPTSVEEAVKELLRMGAGGRVVAILGDMRELEGFSDDAHREVGHLLCRTGVDVFVAVGEKMSLAAEEIYRSRTGTQPPEVYAYKDVDAAGRDIMRILKQGDTVLIKGSRGMSMERIIGGITYVI